MLRAALLAILLVAPAAAPAPAAFGTLSAAVGHVVEAVPLAAGATAWTNGRSNVQAVWSLSAAAPLEARQGGGAATPLELRTARDLTAVAGAWLSSPLCGQATYRGYFLLAARPVHYEVCDAGTEIYVADSLDLRAADAALSVSVASPGPFATAGAYEVVLEGNRYVFAGAPSAAAVTLRQGALLPYDAAGPTRFQIEPVGPADVRVDVHDVVQRSATVRTHGPVTHEVLAELARALP